MKHKDESQTARVLRHLSRYGSITAMAALNMIGCFRLAARIKELRKRGHDIRTSMVETPTGKRIARYTLRTP